MALTNSWICVNTLDIFAPHKKKIWGNNMPFINKNLVNAHRKRTRLRNKFLKNRTESNRVSYITSNEISE